MRLKHARGQAVSSRISKVGANVQLEAEKRHKIGEEAKYFFHFVSFWEKCGFLRCLSSNKRLPNGVHLNTETALMDYRSAKQFILSKLRDELSDKLYYHGLHHTMDVLRMAKEIAASEGVVGRDLTLLKTAALFHDAGFVKDKHAGHEQEGCLMVQDMLPRFGYTSEDVKAICGMIMATKIPQSPTNLLEEIICDADLDYLGRDDFYRIGDSLFEELKEYHLIHDEQEWNRLQVSFLSAHKFHTLTNKSLREPVKQMYLEDLKGLVATY